MKLDAALTGAAAFAATISALLSSAAFKKDGALCWNLDDCFGLENVPEILLLPEILWTGLSNENAVAASPEANINTLMSFTILLLVDFNDQLLINSVSLKRF